VVHAVDSVGALLREHLRDGRRLDVVEDRLARLEKKLA
jgi:hypothetical protein